jgi:hypothetical protein
MIQPEAQNGQKNGHSDWKPMNLVVHDQRS